MSQNRRTTDAGWVCLWAGALLLLGLVVASSTGCAGAPVVRTPGQNIVTIRCNYAGRPESACFRTAARECPRGYRLLSRDQVGHMGMVTIVVECKSAGNGMAQAGVPL